MVGYVIRHRHRLLVLRTSDIVQHPRDTHGTPTAMTRLKTFDYLLPLSTLWLRAGPRSKEDMQFLLENHQVVFLDPLGTAPCNLSALRCVYTNHKETLQSHVNLQSIRLTRLSVAVRIPYPHWSHLLPKGPENSVI